MPGRVLGVKTASNIMIILLSLIIVFHVLILLDILPADLVWGGRLSEGEQLVGFEIFSILINAAMLLILLIRAGHLKVRINEVTIKVSLWMMFIFFVLNTMANLLSVNNAEMAIFTPVAFLMAMLTLRLAVGRIEK